MFTWFAKEKLIDILAKKMDRVKEGVETARDFSLKMEQMVGFSEQYYGSYTWKAKEKLIDLLIEEDELQEAKELAEELLQNSSQAESLVWFDQKMAVYEIIKKYSTFLTDF